MYEKSKYMEIRNFVALNVINRRLKDGDKLYDKEFLINKFRINPSYVERAYKIMLEENLIEKRSDYYYMTIDENKIRSLKNEFANLYVNDYLNKMQKIGADLTEAFSYLAMRMNANG
jgi:DNA-binding transcriptional regulator YhcF (GntR family)